MTLRRQTGGKEAVRWMWPPILCRTCLEALRAGSSVAAVSCSAPVASTAMSTASDKTRSPTLARRFCTGRPATVLAALLMALLAAGRGCRGRGAVALGASEACGGRGGDLVLVVGLVQHQLAGVEAVLHVRRRGAAQRAYR